MKHFEKNRFLHRLMSLIAYIEVGQSRRMHQRHLERSQVFYIQCKEFETN